MMTIKEIKEKAANYIDANNMTKNTYEIERAFIEGAKIAQKQINDLNIAVVSDSTITDEYGTIHTAKLGTNQCLLCRYKNTEHDHPACIKCMNNHSWLEYYR